MNSAMNSVRQMLAPSGGGGGEGAGLLERGATPQTGTMKAILPEADRQVPEWPGTMYWEMKMPV